MLYTLAALAMLVRSGHSASDPRPHVQAPPANVVNGKYTKAFVWYPPAERPPQGSRYGYNEATRRTDRFRFQISPTHELPVKVGGISMMKTRRHGLLFDFRTAPGRNACWEECWSGKGFLELRHFSNMTNGKYRRMAAFKASWSSLLVYGNAQSLNGEAQASGYRNGVCKQPYSDDKFMPYYGIHGMYSAKFFGRYREYYRNDTICPINKTQTISIIFKRKDNKWHYFQMVRNCDIEHVYNPLTRNGYRLPDQMPNGYDILNIIMPKEIGDYNTYLRAGYSVKDFKLETTPLPEMYAQRLEGNSYYEIEDESGSGKIVEKIKENRFGPITLTDPEGEEKAERLEQAAKKEAGLQDQLRQMAAANGCSMEELMSAFANMNKSAK